MTASPASTPRDHRPGWVILLALVLLCGAARGLLAQEPGVVVELPSIARADERTPAPIRQPAQFTGNSIGTDAEESGVVRVSAVPPAPSAVPQPTPPPPAAAPASPIPASAPFSGMVQPTGCSSCGAGLLGLQPPMDYTDGGCADCPNRPCHAGRQQCHPCLADCCIGRTLCALYECICCPDACYDPHWMPIADAAFFVDTPRPQTQQRFRWDLGLNLVLPDRSEFFWPRADGSGKGPTPQAPFKVAPRLRYNQISMYTEAGTGAAGFTFEMPYLAVDPIGDPRAAGFGDMIIGTKTLLFDCELIQIGLLFKTYTPVGNFKKGLGTGHVSLEPSLVVGIKLAQDTYLQGQLCEWIPLGGDPDYAGAVLHYHMSLNQVLFRCLPDVPLVGTLEYNAWQFQDGAYTDPLLGPFQKSSGETYIMPGVGIRLFVCDKCDFGFAAAFAVTQRHFADQLYRTEFRFRF